MVKPTYNIQQLESNKWQIAKWEGGAEPSQVYKVTQDGRGALHCSCPSGMYRGWCKHTPMVRNFQKTGGVDVQAPTGEDNV